MAFTYNLDGPQHIVLTPESHDAWAVDPAIRAEVRDAAQKRANEIGTWVEVFACDGATLLYECKPSA